MTSKVRSASIVGIGAALVEVRVGGPGGVSEGPARESLARAGAALRAGGHDVLQDARAVAVGNWSHAFDLPVAIGMLDADGKLGAARHRNWLFAGQLEFDGTLRPVRGVLLMAEVAREKGLRGVIVPRENAREASVVDGIEVCSARHLNDVVAFLQGEDGAARLEDAVTVRWLTHDPEVDFSEIRGQERAKRALEVAAAGGHNVMLIGSPGSGKAMLARRVTSILPPPLLAEAVETTKIHSVAGVLPEGAGLVVSRPFRAPHYTTSAAGLNGGSIPVPGEAPLAHNGVLFLDELPEFKRYVLGVLEEPLRNGRVTFPPSMGLLSYPASFMLVASMNPCPCGFAGHPTHACTCTPAVVKRYRRQVAVDPLLEYIDIRVEVLAPQPKDLPGEPSAAIRERVTGARKLQIAREGKLNARLAQGKGFSAAVARLSATIADLAGSEIRPGHVEEAAELAVAL